MGHHMVKQGTIYFDMRMHICECPLVAKANFRMALQHNSTLNIPLYR